MPEDVYNMDEIGLHLRAHPNKTLVQWKVKGQKLQNENVTLALVVNITGINKLKLFMIYKSRKPQCLEGGNLMNMFNCTQIKQLG